ncbi:MAG: hypothetical protein KF723_04145 [Rhizobiaceae bacterium]|nr:hypothetical protein [Rhizobiaceae bacterium]
MTETLQSLSSAETAALLAKRRRSNRIVLAALLMLVLAVLSLSVWHISAEAQSTSKNGDITTH